MSRRRYIPEICLGEINPQREARRTGSERKKRIVYVVFSLAYVLCILYITILSRTPSLARTVRPIPFWSLLDCFQGNWARGGSIALNIILFIPLGYLVAGAWKRKCVPFFISLAISIAIEVVQYFSYRGYFDTDDIIVNFLGGVIGAYCYWRFGERLKRWPVPTVLLLAGIIGCIITKSNTVIYETQFDFQIQSVEVQKETITLNGTCDIYRRDFLPYRVQLKGEDGVIQTTTDIKDTQFTATANVPGAEYEVDVVFSEYQTISTGTYLNGDQVVYVPGAPIPEVSGTDLEEIIKNGVLKVYNEDFDVFVYQVEDRLYWIIGADFDASVIYHLYTTEPENLPENRQQYGFDNRGFRIGSEKDLTEVMSCGKYRVFSDIIPREYYVTAIAVGMNKGPDILWREYFRPVR